MTKPALDKKALEAAIEAMDCFASYDTPTTLAEDCVTAYLAALSQAEPASLAVSRERDMLVEGRGYEDTRTPDMSVRGEPFYSGAQFRAAYRHGYDLAVSDFKAATLSPAPAGVQVREALKPFADAADHYSGEQDDDEYVDNDCVITIGQLREARAAYAAPPAARAQAVPSANDEHFVLEFRSKADDAGNRMQGRESFRTMERVERAVRKGREFGRLYDRLTRVITLRYDASDAIAAPASPVGEER